VLEFTGTVSVTIMANSLGLDDDLDGVELVQNLEKAFEIEISNAEAESTLTVGQLYDLLLTKIPANESDRKCASAMAFYRVRRALRNLAQGSALTPSASILFLEERSAKATFEQLERDTGLQMPQLEISYRGTLGCLTVAVAFCAILGFATFFHPGFVSVVNVFALVVTSIAVGWGILHFDSRKLPKSCSTLGGLATKVAALNYGRLSKMGASHSDNEIWKNLLELLSEYALPKSEIGRGTFFLQSQLRNAP
jgi:acyl carrier protein